ncbi:MAG TPA: glycosyltransferase family 2 protein [Pseudobdellovibrionaceae bacterium]|jgi:glycosyltransferase involved in cell wall biosynthesis
MTDNTVAKKIDITLFFPLYKDEGTVESITAKSVKMLSQITENWEILIIDDGSPDRAGVIADALSAANPKIRVIHHETNLGYGAAIRRGLAEARGEWIYFTDGDDEYDVFEFLRIHKIRDFYDLIITFRYKKLYSSKRQFISNVYNIVLRFLFKIRYRDISTGLRAMRKSLVQELILSTNSPFIGAELTIKSDLKGYRIGEMGIQTFPRQFGQGASTSLKNIVATIKDMFKIYNEIFSDTYDLPKNRNR